MSSLGPVPGGSGHDDQSIEPLTERELQLVRRLLSDPFAFPIEFKAWLVSYLESNPPLLTTGSIFGFRSTLAQIVEATALTVPVGGIVAYAADGDPDDDWMLCDGRQISRDDYAVLFARIGTIYGAGNGTTTFNIPNMVGRVAQGKGTHSEVDALGKNDGLAAAARRWLRSLSGSFSGGGGTDGQGAHNHSTGGPEGSPSLAQVQAGTGAIVASSAHVHATYDGAGGHSHGVSVSGSISGSTSGGGFLVVNHIIRVR